jgi:hypothetical protein
VSRCRLAQTVPKASPLRTPRTPLELGAAAGMIIDQPEERGGGAVYYKAVSSTYWRLCTELYKELSCD